MDDALRIADAHAERIAAVLYCDLTPYDAGVLAQLRSRLVGIPFVSYAADDHQFVADGTVVIHSASELIAYLAELQRLPTIEDAA